MDRNPRPKSAIVQRSGMMSSMRNRPTSSLQAWDNECRESDDFLQRIESLEKNFSVFDDVIRQMEEKYVETKTAVHLLKEEYQSKRMKEMEPLKRQNKFYEQDIGRRDREIKELTEEMKSTKDELERTKTRLSQVMGNKLTNNNPNIADLSDGNRPSKLAERLNEIYDNEWTDAYAALLKENKETEAIAEEEIVAELLRALMFINEHCKQLWKKHVSSLETDLKGGQDIDIPDYVKKQLKDCAKNMATKLVEFVYQDSIQALIQTSGGQHRPIFQSSDYHSYIKGCVTVCWFMAAQDPPVVFGTERKKGDKFDPKVFRHYTRTGDLISFVVWPPLYLQEGGPLLSRGVAQTYIVEKEPRTGILAHHISQRMTGDQSERSGVNLYDTQDHSQATSQQTFDSNAYTQPMKTYVWKNEQKLLKHQQSALNLTSNHVHQEQTEISGKSQDPTSEAEKQKIPVWNHSRTPTEGEMKRFSRLMTQRSVQEARFIMGDRLFDMCYDFNNLKTHLAFLDRSTNESSV